MPHPVFRSGARALITGGASGIGLAVARLCHGHGMKIIIVDNNERNLTEVEKSLSGVKVASGDVSKIETWQSLKKRVEEEWGGVDFLMLNAGIGGKGSWEDLEYFHKILDTNLFGVINGVSTFLPLVNTKEPSSIIITGSKQGITNPPGNPAYNMSKSAIKTLAEHLSFDLRSTKTSVHLLVPGWTYTGLTGGGQATEKPAGAWAPEQVAEYLEQKMGEGVFYVICPDNDVTVEKDRRRMLWGVGDIVYERPPLSRWREDWKDKAEEGIAKMKI